MVCCEAPVPGLGKMRTSADGDRWEADQENKIPVTIVTVVQQFPDLSFMVRAGLH